MTAIRCPTQGHGNRLLEALPEPVSAGRDLRTTFVTIVNGPDYFAMGATGLDSSRPPLDLSRRIYDPSGLGSYIRLVCTIDLDGHLELVRPKWAFET